MVHRLFSYSYWFGLYRPKRISGNWGVCTILSATVYLYYTNTLLKKFCRLWFYSSNSRLNDNEKVWGATMKRDPSGHNKTSLCVWKTKHSRHISTITFQWKKSRVSYYNSTEVLRCLRNMFQLLNHSFSYPEIETATIGNRKNWKSIEKVKVS